MKDITGQRYGLLVAVRPLYKDKANKWIWEWKCDCGNTRKTSLNNVMYSEHPSCGCFKTQATILAHTIHGINRDEPIYAIWRNMKRRCNVPKCKAYPLYGGRGIKVCDEWNSNFKTFYEWALENGWKKGAKLSIDRIDSDGPYSPENCRWVTMKVQCNNKRNNVRIKWNDEIHTAQEWSEITGIQRDTIVYRIRHGWSVEKALTKHPVHNI